MRKKKQNLLCDICHFHCISYPKLALKKGTDVFYEFKMFSTWAKWFSHILGNAKAFLIAIFAIIIWAFLGPYFQFSNAWQLVINTGTTIVTFLMVFLIQNTQNRDTLAIHLKLDEIIRAIKSAHNELLEIEDLTDEDLEGIHKRYIELANNIKKHMKKGKKIEDTEDL